MSWSNFLRPEKILKAKYQKLPSVDQWVKLIDQSPGWAPGRKGRTTWPRAKEGGARVIFPGISSWWKAPSCSSLTQTTNRRNTQFKVGVCLQGHSIMTSFGGNYHLGQLKGTVKSQLELLPTSSSSTDQVITWLMTAVCIQFTWAFRREIQVSDLRLSLNFTFYTGKPLFSYRTQQPITWRYDALARYRKAYITWLQSNLFIYFHLFFKVGENISVLYRN